MYVSNDTQLARRTPPFAIVSSGRSDHSLLRSSSCCLKVEHVDHVRMGLLLVVKFLPCRPRSASSPNQPSALDSHVRREHNVDLGSLWIKEENLALTLP